MFSASARRSLLAAGASGLLTAVIAASLAAPAGAATFKATAQDAVGDGPAPGRDITEVKVRYKTNGSVLFVVTTAGPIDGAGADALVGVSLGSSCRRVLLTGGGQFSDPDPVAFSKITGRRLGKPRRGEGEITGNVYTLLVKHSSFKHWKPSCYAVVLLDPATAAADSPTIFDQTDELRIKR